MPAQVSPVLLRKINERRVLEMIQSHGPQSRADVRRGVGMSAPTVSKAVASLLEHGFLEEREDLDPGMGRPAKLLHLACQTASVLGIVIDKPDCWVVAAGLDGELNPEKMRSFPLPKTYRGLLQRLQEQVNSLMQASGEKIPGRGKVLGIGVSVPGLVNSQTDEIVFSPNLHLLDGRQPAADLEGALGIECRMFQEAHALCLGELMYGAARGLDNFAMLDVSTGLGLGVMSGGQLLTGHSGLAGELGHITVERHGIPCGCGNHGCLETVATDSALARLVSKRIGREVSIEETVRLIRAGEIDAREELEATCEYLAIGVSAVINIFNPTTLFVHGKLLGAGEDVFEEILRHVQQRTLRPSLADCRVLQARGSKRQGAVAGMIHHLTDSWAPRFPKPSSRERAGTQRVGRSS